MFDQIKNLYNLKKQAEELQKQMANERFSAVSGPVTLTIDGNQELVDVQIGEISQSNPANLARDFKQAFAQAQKDMKKTMAEKFRGMM